MLLSIFSFNREFPDKNWSIIALWSLFVIVCLVSGYEILLKSLNFENTLRIDNRGLWANIRDNIKENKKNQMVLLGASRMQQDVVPNILQNNLKNNIKVHQLAIAGAKELPLLKHFTNDDNFKGYILFSFFPEHISRDFLTSKGVAKRDRSIDYINYYKNETVSQKISLTLYNYTNYYFAFPGSLETGFLKIIKNVIEYKDINNSSRYGKNGISINFNRLIKADYNSNWGNKRRIKKYKINDIDEVITNKEVDFYITELNNYLKPYIKRGGKVIIIRLPSSGYYREKENKLYPKNRVWERIKNETKTATLHFEDYKELSKFKCGDASHLDYKDAPDFTKLLAEVLNDFI